MASPSFPSSTDKRHTNPYSFIACLRYRYKMLQSGFDICFSCASSYRIFVQMTHRLVDSRSQRHGNRRSRRLPRNGDRHAPRPQTVRTVKVVGTRGIEPLTPAMSRRCSPAELRALSAPLRAGATGFKRIPGMLQAAPSPPETRLLVTGRQAPCRLRRPVGGGETAWRARAAVGVQSRADSERPRRSP